MRGVASATSSQEAPLSNLEPGDLHKGGEAEGHSKGHKGCVGGGQEMRGPGE